MLNPFLPDAIPENPPAPSARPTYIALLPVLLYVLAAIAFLILAACAPDIITASLFVASAVVILSIGIVLGLSIWVFPGLSR